MGYYYDHVDRKWEPIDHDRRLTGKQKQRLSRRKHLIVDLLTEINKGQNSVTALYAGLLARALVKTDELLMREYGETVIKVASENKAESRVQLS